MKWPAGQTIPPAPRTRPLNQISDIFALWQFIRILPRVTVLNRNFPAGSPTLPGRERFSTYSRERNTIDNITLNEYPFSEWLSKCLILASGPWAQEQTPVIQRAFVMAGQKDIHILLYAWICGNKYLYVRGRTDLFPTTATTKDANDTHDDATTLSTNNMQMNSTAVVLMVIDETSLELRDKRTNCMKPHWNRTAPN